MAAWIQTVAQEYVFEPEVEEDEESGKNLDVRQWLVQQSLQHYYHVNM